MLIVICGPRDWDDVNYIWTMLDDLNVRGDVDSLFVGDALGVDGIAARWAKERGISCKTFWADWSTGRSAGVARSARMLDSVGSNAVVIALVPSGRPMTTGTGHTVRMAIERGMSVRVESPDGRAWRSDWSSSHLLVDQFEVSL